MASEIHLPKVNKSRSGQVLNNMREKVSLLQRFITKFNNDWAMMVAGALAYSLLTAIVPIFLAIIAVLGFILPGSVDYIMHNLYLGKNATLNQALASQLRLAIAQLNRQAGFIAILAVATAIFGGSRLFVALEGCLDIVYSVRPRKFILQNIMAISMMLLFIILVPIMIFAATIPGIAQAIIVNNPVIRQIPAINTLANNTFTIYLIGFIGGLLAAFLLFWGIYTIVPNLKITLGQSWQGAIVAAVALELFITLVFPFYTTRFMGNYAGQAGLVVILIVFFYYFAVILMLGAEVNAFFVKKIQPLPNDLVTFISTMGGKLNKDTPEDESPHHIDPRPTDKVDEKHVAESEKL